MTRRLPLAAPLRGLPTEVSVAGATVRGFTGESVAAAALASGARVLSRSLKYHRPRGLFCLEGHCGGCLVRVDGVPNLRACQVTCAPGLKVEAQNAFPSAEVDLLGAVDFVFARGMDHHGLMTGSAVLNQLASRVVRQLSGLGKLPGAVATATPPVAEHRVDVAVIGGGPAGLAAAEATARAGASTVLLDDQLRLGGSLRAEPSAGPAAAARAEEAAAAAGALLLPRTGAIAYFPEDAGGVLLAASDERAARVHARHWIWATGGYAQNLAVPNNDRPGVVALRAVGRLLADHGILAGERICAIVDPAVRRHAQATVDALRAAGAEVSVLDVSEVDTVRGRSGVTGVDLVDGRQLDCDLVAMAALPAPATEGPRQQGCAVVLDPAAGGFRLVTDDAGRTSAPTVWGCGDVCGYRGPREAAADGARVGAQVARALAAEAT
ncbi:MAG: 2Fe-2S iron-sulfur cluster-binding protein [Kofleriaceae bacterium]